MRPCSRIYYSDVSSSGAQKL